MVAREHGDAGSGPSTMAPVVAPMASSVWLRGLATGGMVAQEAAARVMQRERGITAARQSRWVRSKTRWVIELYGPPTDWIRKEERI